MQGGPVTVTYGPAAMPAKNGQATTVTVTNTETAVLTSTDPRWWEKSQLSLYLGTIVLGVSGGNTQIKVRHYFSLDGGVTYKQVPVQNLSTGELLNQPDLITTNSPASLVIDKPISGANAYKCTLQTDVGTATIADVSLMVRDN